MALLLSVLSIALLIGADQFTKHLAVVHLREQPPIVIWPDVFELQYCENPGVAFSLLENQRWIFIPLTVIIMLLVIVVMFRSPLCKHVLFRLSCVLIAAGGIGNLIDRIYLGYVIDFLYFKLIDFPIFNVADCCVVVGAIFLIFYLLFIFKEEDAPLKTLLFGLK